MEFFITSPSISCKKNKRNQNDVKDSSTRCGRFTGFSVQKNSFTVYFLLYQYKDFGNVETYNEHCKQEGTIVL